MAARLGPGWTLRQRAGDAETITWLVSYQRSRPGWRRWGRDMRPRLTPAAPCEGRDRVGGGGGGTRQRLR
ncbi:hypothetical protein GCM10009780_68800 [Actinomadura alba]